MREGALLIEPVFRTPEGTGRSCELAKCRGIDPWDFRTHAFDPDRVVIEHLHAMFEPNGKRASVERFSALRAVRYRLFFRPNG